MKWMASHLEPMGRRKSWRLATRLAAALSTTSPRSRFGTDQNKRDGTARVSCHGSLGFTSKIHREGGAIDTRRQRCAEAALAPGDRSGSEGAGVLGVRSGLRLSTAMT